jgi:anti-anti-sigma factor
LVGELDLKTVESLREALAALGSDGPVTLELSRLTFIDSSGLYAIAAFAREQLGTPPLVLANPSAAVMHVFEIVDFPHNPALEITQDGDVD